MGIGARPVLMIGGPIAAEDYSDLVQAMLDLNPLLIHAFNGGPSDPITDLSGHGHPMTYQPSVITGAGGVEGDAFRIADLSGHAETEAKDYGQGWNVLDETVSIVNWVRLNSAIPTSTEHAPVWMGVMAGSSSTNPIGVSLARDDTGGSAPYYVRFGPRVGNGTTGNFGSLSLLDSNPISVAQMTLGQWHMIAVTWNSATGVAKLYFDGNLVRTGTTNTGKILRLNGRKWIVGGNGVSGYTQVGADCDVTGLYSTILSDGDIAAIWAASGL